MLDRIHGKCFFECEGCGDTLDTGESDFNDALIALRDEGWVARKIGSEWVHECPECQNKLRKYR